MRVLPVALEDLAGIARYYRGVAPGQVARFRAEYRATVRRIREWPHLGSEDRPNSRHRAIRVFPYNVFYTLDEDAREVVIVAVLDQMRDPALARLRSQ